jgi:hypothetical protein
VAGDIPYIGGEEVEPPGRRQVRSPVGTGLKDGRIAVLWIGLWREDRGMMGVVKIQKHLLLGIACEASS